MRPLPPELAKIAREELNETPERVQQDLVILRTWIYQQRYLHARTSTDFLIAFLRRCRYSLEQTKKRIDDFFTFHTRFPEIVSNRRVTEKILTINRLGLQYFPEFPRCSDHAAIMITRVGCCPKRYHMREVMAYTSMAMELIALENDNAAVVGVVQIFDLSDLDVEHAAQLDGGLFRKWWYWMSECSPLRINVTYCLNAPKELQSWLGVLRALRVKMGSNSPMFIVKSLEELYQYIPQKCLPEEYGGTNGHLHECVSYMEDLLKSYRDYFEDEVNYGTIEQLRHGEIMPYEAEFGAEGSFRQLIVD
ncbi:alpha-tocopherol transfer protein-like [Zeugodacus cucurbitae]|uniref:alpha-tocopherol transfer protein-like n=1 Tax=Zeugodacus cucurbitae TaxID=28588 RepID=UPI0023D91D73|nr:alpha-tocopherol transfer protein-like [Zeugodacus cucurbitae]